MLAMRNVGTADRWARAALGVILIGLASVGPQAPWGWIGLIPLATVFMGFCPAYRLLGMRTCALDQGKPPE